MKLARFAPLLSLVVLFGCNGGDNSTTGTNPTTQAPSGSDFKVALLTPGPVSDSGWNAMANDGLQAIKSEMGATVDSQEAKGTQIRDAFRSYAQKNYNLIIGHGYEYNAPAAEVAKDFPDTVFVTSSGGETAKNLGAFRFQLEQGFYVAGVMAASMSKTGKVGTVALGGIPSIESTLKAFEAGAKATNPKIEVKKVYINDDKDVPAAQQATEQLAASGVDFVIHQANNAAQGVFNAAKAKGIYAFGANFDQNNNESGAVIASAVIVGRPAFLKLAQEVKDKKFVGRIVSMGMTDGVIEFVLNPKLQTKIPTSVLKKVADTEAGIKSGAITVPMDKF